MKTSVLEVAGSTDGWRHLKSSMGTVVVVVDVPNHLASQTVGGAIRDYLLGLQPGLVKVLAQDEVE